jgi:phosphoadenosine phosphosulfate reductase
MPQVFFIDEGDPFPEITAFMDRLVREWGIELAVIRNDDLLAAGVAGGSVSTARLSQENRRELERAGWRAPEFRLDPEAFPASHLLKTVPLRRHLEGTGIVALATAIRRDEHPARQAETAFSPREEPRHVRVHPLLSFREREVWEATFGLDLPFCELYRAGYRSLGCRSGTVKNADIPAWEQDMENTPERAGRHQGKEAAMAQLRALGYM